MKTQITILSIILTMSFGFNTKCLCQLTLTTDSVLQTSLCAGGTVIVKYTVSGGSYNFGNVFTAQLSQDADMMCLSGTFSNPIDIGTTPYWNSGFIIGTVPANTPLGFYRVRVISSSPVDTGSISPNCVFIANMPSLVVTVFATPDDTICEGDSATLSVMPLPAASYLWSTGETTESIIVTQSGSYFVTVTDTFGCETTSDTTDVVVKTCSTGISENNAQNSVSVYPNPNAGRFTLTLTAGQLNSSFVLYDLPGKEVIRIDEIKEPVIEISAGNIPDGIYIYNIVNEHNITGAGKLIINRHL